MSNLLKINDVSKINNQSVKGALFENMIISEYVKQIHHKSKRLIDTWFWRDSHGNEVDLLLEKSQHTEIVEIKATGTVIPDLFKGLNYFSSLMNDNNLEKTLVYGGSENQQRRAGRVVSWKDLDI